MGTVVSHVADLDRDTWLQVLRRSARKLLADECTDQAAALTYYGVLSLFPAVIAVISLVGVVGDGPKTVRTLLDIAQQLGADSATRTLEPTLTSLAEARHAGLTLVVGLLLAVWSASGYVGAFGRAMNRIYGIPEGRPFWKLRPWQVLVTVVVLVLAAFVALALVVSGPTAQAIGDAVGLGSTAVLVWQIVKWPLLLGAVVFVVGVLYHATPNVKHPTFRWLSVGALIAIVVWVVASLLFGVYVATFASYNKVYGSLAGVIVFLLWLWITNLALLLGGEVDTEIERGRELRAGLPAEEELQLELRDTSAADKAEEQRQEEVSRARELRGPGSG
ncbi:MAG: YihY/virulence factor BrkB family protein [Nocardioidaceae bacterium]|nr:YihY/virulence factor BrkB family protein [Nocardioidaceae bacterium]NUS49514.1 YihY/virulence factor BrkB family protein [Nocardioidaceae bacterium]